MRTRNRRHTVVLTEKDKQNRLTFSSSQRTTSSRAHQQPDSNDDDSTSVESTSTGHDADDVGGVATRKMKVSRVGITYTIINHEGHPGAVLATPTTISSNKTKRSGGTKGVTRHNDNKEAGQGTPCASSLHLFHKHTQRALQHPIALIFSQRNTHIYENECQADDTGKARLAVGDL